MKVLLFILVMILQGLIAKSDRIKVFNHKNFGLPSEEQVKLTKIQNELDQKFKDVMNMDMNHIKFL